MTTATQIKPLTEAQRHYLEIYIRQLGEEERARDEAQRAVDKAQVSANAFLGYCAKELSAPGKEGWVFNQEEMCFVQMPTPPQGDSGQKEGN